jgi:hypothetical protein
VLQAGTVGMPRRSKRSKQPEKRTVKLTFLFTPEDVEFINRASARARVPRATWGFLRLQHLARKELGLEAGPDPSKPSE